MSMDDPRARSRAAVQARRLPPVSASRRAPPTGVPARDGRADAAELAPGAKVIDVVFGGVVTGYTLRDAGGIRPAPEGGAVPRPRVMRPAESHGAIVVTGFNILSSPRGRGGLRLTGKCPI